jgi:hypothetical protein
LQPHRLASSIAFWEDSLPDPLLGNNSIARLTSHSGHITFF